MVTARAGAAAWSVQPLYVAVELVVALVVVPAAGRSTSLAADTISSLGTSGSPGHGVINGAFVVFGLLRLAGALLVRRLLPRGAVSTVAVALWVVSGVGAVAVGVTPIDVDHGLHVLVATPVFAAQPLALLLTGVALRDRVGMAGGVVCAVAAVLFALGPVPGLGGGFERLALWPAYLWLGVVGVRLARAADTLSAGGRSA